MDKYTILAAWWGAIIATLILAWDIFKWKRSGPLVSVSASPNMQTVGGIPDALEDKTFLFVTATNTGNRQTTITHLVGLHYSSLLQRLRKKRNKAFFVASPAFAPRLPHILGPGEQWLGGIEQNAELEELSRNGFLYCGVYHSSSRRPVLQRVFIPEEIAR